MTPQYLVDTDWVIHYLNGRDDIVHQVRALRPDGLGLSVIALAELYEGVYYSRDPQKDEQGLSDFLQGVVILGIDEETAKIFGHERGRLRAAGLLIGDTDLLIAATALAANLPLYTRNPDDFAGLSDLLDVVPL